ARPLRRRPHSLRHSAYPAPRDLPSFPTRRSSDLGPGHRVREVFTEGGGVPGLVAVEQDATGNALKLALSYAKGIGCTRGGVLETDRKSTRLNSSHRTISYAVFCLKKKSVQQYQAT